MAERRPRSLDLYQTSRNYGKYLERRVEALEQRNAELEARLQKLEQARQRLIKMINDARPDNPVKAGLVQAYAIWSEASE